MEIDDSPTIISTVVIRHKLQYFVSGICGFSSEVDAISKMNRLFSNDYVDVDQKWDDGENNLGLV